MVNRTLSTEKIYTLLDHFQDGIFVVDQGIMVYANQKLQNMLEYTLDDILGKPFGSFIYEDDRALVSENYEKRQKGEETPEEYEFRLLSKSQKVIEVRINVGKAYNDSGDMLALGTLHDLTEQKSTLIALEQSQSDIQSILDHMPDVFYRTNSQGVITMISPSCESALGYTPEEMIGEAMSSFYCQADDRDRILKALKEGQGKATQVVAQLKHKDGTPKWVSTNAYIRFDDDHEMIGVEGISRDITKTKNLEERLKQYAQIDDLTQVYNRRYFLKEAQVQLDIAKRYQRPIAVLMIDLDSFKKINDTYGHHVGDEVLKHFAQSCKNSLRSTDFIGRLGGEEFSIISPETSLDAAVMQAQRIRDTIKQSHFLVDGQKISYTVSIGVAVLCPVETATIEDILLYADKALYKAKEKRDHIEAISCSS